MITTRTIGRAAGVSVLLLLGALLSSCVPQNRNRTADFPERRISADNHIFGEISDAKPQLPGRINIQSVGTFNFNPSAVETVRTDTFRDGFFSIFDILVHLDSRDQIEMEYHFDPRLDTHVIDSLNGEPYWWYRAFYDGGWAENNVFRMDLFPYKDRMQIRVFPQNKKRVEELRDLFQDETTEKRRNNGGVVTAVDVIMSLADQGLLSFDLQWYESIGEARVIKNYFVERINEDRTKMRCGFVYEAGALAFRGRGNHIHLPPDARVIHAPEYVEFFWICV